MSELKPCPFCGHNPERKHDRVKCSNPDCLLGSWFPIEAWNTRPASPALDRLKELVEKLWHTDNCRVFYTANNCTCGRNEALRIIEELK